MNAAKKILLYGTGLLASFVLGVWFASGKNRIRNAPAEPLAITASSAAKTESTHAMNEKARRVTSQSEAAEAYALVATSPRAAMEEAMKLPESKRLATMQNLMAVWLRADRLAAAEWMTERRGLREFEPLSAQVSDAFFPDDTEMSAMFCFDLSDATLRDVRVNKLVGYWKSGAHLKFDNSPWEVDGPGSSSGKMTVPNASTEASAKEAVLANGTEPRS